MDNLKTTITGWIAVLSAAIAAKPDLVEFLPDDIRAKVVGISGLIAVTSGMAFSVAAKDANDNPPKFGGLKIIPIITAVVLLGGCAWLSEHSMQLKATGKIISKKAANVALGVAFDAIGQKIEGRADWLDSAAAGLRANAKAMVTVDDIEAVVRVWTPPGQTWPKQLAKGVASIAAQELKGKPVGMVAEGIAKGLNDAAGLAR